jgi:hypothetical protein
MNALLATPIRVPNGDRREQLEGTGDVGNIHQPFQRRMELCNCKLSMPAIGCRKLEPGDPIRVIVQEEMHQFVREVAEDGMHHKQSWLRQGAALCPGKVLHSNTEIAPGGLGKASPSLDKTQGSGPWGLRARPHAAAQPCGHAAFRLF